MSDQKRRARGTLVDILVAVAGLILLALFLNSMQTRLSVRRQRQNSGVKLDIAQQHMERNAAEAAENLSSYDAFAQAKLESVTYFLDTHPGYRRQAELAGKWGLLEYYWLDEKGAVLYCAKGGSRDFTEGALNQLLTLQTPVTVGDVRFYIARREEGYAVGARVFSQENDTLEALRSPANALKDIQVGTGGFVFAVDPLAKTFEYHPSAAYVGRTIGEAELDADALQDGYEGWLDMDGVRYYAMARQVGDDLFVAVEPEEELAVYNRRTVLIALTVFALVIALLVAYARILRADAARPGAEPAVYLRLGKNLYFNKTMSEKISQVAAISLLAIFVLSFYAQTLSALSRQSALSGAKLESIGRILADNDRRIEKLTSEYNLEFAQRARNIAWTLNEDPAMLSEEALSDLAARAQLNTIFVFNGYGQTVATNTAYKDYKLSGDINSSAYPFWDVVKGYKDQYVQKANVDETKSPIQYVGVKRLDDKGMVEIGISPRQLANRLKVTRLDYLLRSVAVENEGFLFAVDGESMTLLSYDDATLVGGPITAVGLSETAVRNGYMDYQTIGGRDCYLACRKLDGAFIFLAVPVSDILAARLPVALLVTAGGFLVMLVLCACLLLSRSIPEPAVGAARRPAGGQEQKHFFQTLIPGGKTRVVQSAASRWSGGGLPWRERTPEQKLMRVLTLSLGAASALLLVWVFHYRGADADDGILSYIMSMRWEKAPNIFSATYILMFTISVMVISGALRKLILYATRRFGARCETVGRLVESFVKYLAIIGAVFYSLNFLGIDSAALMTSAGILALVIGLGAQKLIGDILAGIFIVFEGEFRVGDIVTIDDWRGTVMEIGIRTTKIQSPGQDIKIFNNSVISGVVNMTKQYSYASAVVGVEYGESLEHVESILNRELPLMKDRLPAIVSGPFYQGVTELADSSVNIRITAQCHEKDRLQLERDLNRELKLIFDRNGVGIPFPQIVINRPAEHSEATRSEKREAAAFVEEQKELSKDIHVKDE